MLAASFSLDARRGREDEFGAFWASSASVFIFHLLRLQELLYLLFYGSESPSHPVKRVLTISLFCASAVLSQGRRVPGLRRDAKST